MASFPTDAPTLSTFPSAPAADDDDASVVPHPPEVARFPTSAPSPPLASTPPPFSAAPFSTMPCKTCFFALRSAFCLALLSAFFFASASTSTIFGAGLLITCSTTVDAWASAARDHTGGGAWTAVASPTQGVAGSLGCETPPHLGDDGVGGVVGAGSASTGAGAFFARPLHPPAGGGGGGGNSRLFADSCCGTMTCCSGVLGAATGTVVATYAFAASAVATPRRCAIRANSSASVIDQALFIEMKKRWLR